MSELEANIDGLENVESELQRLARELSVTSGPFTQAMRRATLIVTRAAKINSPVDTGRLRSSITPAIRTSGIKIVGVVGSIVEYAPKIEQPGPVRRTGRRPYLQPALNENRSEIFDLLNNAVAQIVEG